MPADTNTVSHAGIVQSITAGEAVIAVAVQGCASCGQKRSCGVGKLTGSGKVSLIRLPATSGMQVGDTVSLSIDQDAIHRAALVGYLLPAILLVLGTVIGQSTLSSDVGAALGAIAGIALGLLLTRLIPRLFPGMRASLSASFPTNSPAKPTVQTS